jgi:hypothetical protein
MELSLTEDDAHRGCNLSWLRKCLQRSYKNLVAEAYTKSKRNLCSNIPDFGGFDFHLVKEDGTNQRQKRTDNLIGNPEPRLACSDTADDRSQCVKAHKWKGVNTAHDSRVTFD